MAYNNIYPQYFQNPYLNQQIPQMNYQQTPQQVMQTPMANQQIQNGGLVNVHSIDEARNYPVSLGTSVMFKDESSPNVIYTKTMGFNQLDTPKFEKYRLVKEEDAPQTSNLPHTGTKEEKVDNSSAKELKAEIERLNEEMEELWKEVESLKKQTSKSTNRKKEVNSDDSE